MKTFALIMVMISVLSVAPEPNVILKDVEISGTVVDSQSKEKLPGVLVWIKELNRGTATNLSGEFSIEVSPGTYNLVFSYIGYEKFEKEIRVSAEGVTDLTIELVAEVILLEEIVISAQSEQSKKMLSGAVVSQSVTHRAFAPAGYRGSEEYDEISENSFHLSTEKPLSTFSIDVDGASYANVRRMINDGYLPPVDAVRIEEMINYFNYSYDSPKGDVPFAVSMEAASAPWNSDHQIVQIGIQGMEIESESLPPSNLVFLLDVSGSMQSPDKLPLIKQGFRLLVNQLREEDYVSIVVYAGSSGLVLPPTSGYEKDKILEAIDQLNAGGSTAGAQGIRQAYKVARQNFREDANNRVILATDGDFNVGASNDDELVKLIESKRDDGIFLSVLGFGTGNLKDSKMEKIANHGNGNYYYIDNLLEAKKVLVSEMGGTLHTIAKDVKIQVEFNPANVQAYRLIGYENRLLADRDFNDNTKDAGELGAGHTVTALYEIIPSGVEIDPEIYNVDPLKYQENKTPTSTFSDELMTVKLRYKAPDGNESKLISQVVRTQEVNNQLSTDLSFAASVASFGMLLRDSDFKGESSFEMVNTLAKNGLGEDDQGYRAEFIRIAEHAHLLFQGRSQRD